MTPAWLQAIAGGLAALASWVWDTIRIDRAARHRTRPDCARPTCPQPEHNHHRLSDAPTVSELGAGRPVRVRTRGDLRPYLAWWRDRNREEGDR